MAFGNGPRLVTTGLDLLVDAADRQSYPGSGTSWRDLKSSTTGSLTGSVSYTSEFYGGLTFTDSSSAVIFPSTVANYGTGSFTVEMAFKPTFINGRHYLMAKNSGSFPNWSIYLSGSNGSGKLWSEFNISAAISCSVSSSTTFTTGSVYQVDVVLAPGLSGSGITVNGIPQGGVLGNGSGTLTNTSSLFIGNFSQNNTQNFSGSIYTTKVYGTTGFTLPVVNYNATSTRFSQPPVSDTARKIFELLVVAGGGGGGGYSGGGGGAGGLQYISNYIPQIGNSVVIVGDGGLGLGTAFDTSIPGNAGQNSSFANLVSIGGGGGGTNSGAGASGGSGGGSGNSTISSGTSGQGSNGGTGSGTAGGGGGGAGSTGFNSIGNIGGTGGSGSFIASFAAVGGSPAGWFAGGGGGMYGTSLDSGIGGIGGGGNAGRSGSANTGGGGGPQQNVKGGSGIVAIRYNGTPIALGGEITQSEGYTYHVYRTVGTSSFTIF